MKNQRPLTYILGTFCLFLLLPASNVLADDLYYGISDETSHITTTSASKRDEDLFSSPLSISVLTENKIKRSGVTSIPEALRLLPGVLVREQTNGIYEVHIRGLENAPNNLSLTSLNSRLVLLMIDNRIVYDYFDGGMFWQSLPVDINDISRIELIRGPASALYGSNAVQGVIHIITKRADDNTYASANLVTGNHETLSGHFEAGTQINDQSLRVSGFSNQRDRYQQTYYSFIDNDYLPVETLPLTDSVDPFQSPEQSLQAEAITIALNNHLESLWHYDLTLSHQESESHRIYLTNADTPFTYNDSRTSAINGAIAYDDLKVRASHHWGTNDAAGFPDFDYDMAISQVSVEYQYRLPKWLIQPGLYYDEVSYKSNFIGGKKTLTTTAFMLRSEYTPTPESRLIGAFRLDDYRVPSDQYPSFQLLGSYLLTPDTLLRGGVMTANRSAFMITHYTDLTFEAPEAPGLEILVRGDNSLELTKFTTYELALRKQLQFNHWFEVELFRTEARDYFGYVNEGLSQQGDLNYLTYRVQSLPSKVTQQGITTNWFYEQLNWDINAFITWQRTTVNQQINGLTLPILTTNEANQGTPKFFGGLDINWRPMPKWNINANVYFLDEHALTFSSPALQAAYSSHVTANVTAKHQFNRYVSGYVSARNIAKNRNAQYFYTDGIDPLYLVGIELTWIK